MSDLAPTGIRHGDWYAFCQVCTRRFFGSSMMIRGDEKIVCDECWEEWPDPQDTPPPIGMDPQVPEIINPNPNSTLTALNDPVDIDTDGGNWYGGGTIL